MELPNEDPKQALVFLSDHALKLKTNEDEQDAFALATIETAHYQLLVGQIDACKVSIKTTEKILATLSTVSSSINASFYRVSADYYKITLAYPLYYHNALLYLSSVKLDQLPVAVKQSRAFDLATSALLGDGLYNFGELLMHPILDSLKDSPCSWLRTLLLQYNSGDLEGFEKVTKSKDFLSQVFCFVLIPSPCL